MTKKFDYAIVGGRMRPPTICHHALINEAYKIADKVIIWIGSAKTAPNPKNPFTSYEIEDILKKDFPDANYAHIMDYPYSDIKWQVDFAQQIQSTISINGDTYKDMSIALVGCKKDASSYYLDMFPNWRKWFIDPIGNISATDIRKALFEFDEIDNVPDSTRDALTVYQSSEAWKNMKAEYDYYEDYKSSWQGSPFIPTFNTSDVIVMQSGHILLITRGFLPGKGLLALPGGFVNQNETTRDAAIRELVEETNIKLPESVIEGRLSTSPIVADYPGRSLRGKVISHAYTLRLQDTLKLPKVKGGDDARNAEWHEIGTVIQHPEWFFEDHWHIINKALGLF